MTRTSLLLLALPLCALAADGELWLVELEHNDGLRLQFQGAELELGNAALSGVAGNDELRPGMRLAILSRDGVAERIGMADAITGFLPTSQWRRAEASLLAVTGRALRLQGLGVLAFDEDTRWLNGSPADLQPGRKLVLSRNEQGRLTEILIANPEDEPE
ncbi:TPA: hypothetical protein I8303_002292 [Aeromonas hydrophila]|uniref:hypothetical protein n=1 Tax=Aeromonas TaxID=642 RepID=UPI000C3255AA|nr:MULTISPECIES: hypothetical protein [Aeromonas]PKD22715.1 hypothetical protein AO056_03942 [Aeromonas hydrophila]WEA29758.1 hypothetical protein PWO56_21330 [Aeromonas hydrophila]WRK91197.1 hypothetical protein U8518_17475 [Aeromonas hydrophila]HAT2713562.1 hypothetical protein [Aeromonas hydrophila]